MKVEEITEELMPRNRTPKAAEIAKEIVNAVSQRYGKGDETYNPEMMAKKMAAAFHQAMVAAIDEELKYSQMDKVSSHGRSGSFNARA